MCHVVMETVHLQNVNNHFYGTVLYCQLLSNVFSMDVVLLLDVNKPMLTKLSCIFDGL